MHEENTVNLEVSFSDLLMKPKENIFPMGEQVIVEVISPDEETVYCLKKWEMKLLRILPYKNKFLLQKASGR